jgi:hypothetical protein
MRMICKWTVERICVYTFLIFLEAAAGLALLSIDCRRFLVGDDRLAIVSLVKVPCKCPVPWSAGTRFLVKCSHIKEIAA